MSSIASANSSEQSPSSLHLRTTSRRARTAAARLCRHRRTPAGSHTPSEAAGAGNLITKKQALTIQKVLIEFLHVIFILDSPRVTLIFQLTMYTVSMLYLIIWQVRILAPVIW